MKQIQFKKLIITFFAHLWVAMFYGSIFGFILVDYGMPKEFVLLVQVITIVLVTYVAYQEEIRRYYPFLKALGVNALGLFLFFVVAFIKIPLLHVIGFIVVVFAIKYRCKKCVEYKRYDIG